MRMMGAASLVAVCGMLACAPAQADWVPPFKGNDTGGIIAYPMATQTDVRQLAVDHCARYGKVVKFLAVRRPIWRLHLLRLPLGALWRHRPAAAHALLSHGIASGGTGQSGVGSMTRQLLSLCLGTCLSGIAAGA